MFYLSDHGESLGELGVYLHGLPYAIAPDAQTQVPFIVWAGTNSDIDRDRLFALRDEKVTHDVFSTVLLDAFEVTVQGEILSRGGIALPMRFDADEGH